MFIFDVTRFVPKFILWDKNGYAIAKALEAGLQMMNDAIQKGVDCITDIDKMPEWRLDELGWETNFLYDYSADVEAKRRLLKEVFHIYRRLGTKRAVENALQAIFPGSELQEWFDYGGEPYHFRLEIEVPGTGVTPEQQDQVLRNILFYKNVRSVLDGITYTIPEMAGGVYLGAVFGSGVMSTLLPELEPVQNYEATVYAGAAPIATRTVTELQTIGVGFADAEHIAVCCSSVKVSRKLKDLEQEA